MGLVDGKSYILLNTFRVSSRVKNKGWPRDWMVSIIQESENGMGIIDRATPGIPCWVISGVHYSALAGFVRQARLRDTGFTRQRVLRMMRRGDLGFTRFLNPEIQLFFENSVL